MPLSPVPSIVKLLKLIWGSCHRHIREYLTGFHKRNVARQAIGKAKAQERDKAMRQEQRKEVRHTAKFPHMDTRA